MRTAPWTWVLLLAVAVAGLAAKRYAFEATWYLNRSLAYLRTLHFSQWESPHFTVRYPRGCEEDARLVLAAAEHFYPLVNRDFGGRLPGKNLIILVDRFSDDQTMGLYSRGVIEVLAPSRWLPAAERAPTFYSEGPVAHELTHLAVDLLTRGNVPLWFTEGMAQYEEAKLGGRQAEPEGSGSRWEEAYAQSLERVLRLKAYGGEEYLYQIMAKLALGARINEVLPREYAG